jgi:hypothetical protein
LKIFIKKSVLFLISIIISIVFVNYFGYKSNIYNDRYKIAKVLNEGNNVTNLENFNERLVRMHSINMLKKAPDMVVLGSSRVMGFSTKHFKHDIFYNNGVSGASLEDYISIYQCYKERNILPKKLIIEITPWIFNKNNGQSRWKTLESYYNRYKNVDDNIITDAEIFARKYRPLLSLSYFQYSLPELIFGEKKPRRLINNNYNKLTMLTDGSIIYPNEYRNADQKVVNNKILELINQKEIYGLYGFNTFSKALFSDFNNFIDECKSKNICLEFYLIPYPPLVFDKIEQDYLMVLETEKAIKEIADKNDIKCIGTYDPLKLNIDESHFVDATHLNHKGISIILEH